MIPRANSVSFIICRGDKTGGSIAHAARAIHLRRFRRQSVLRVALLQLRQCLLRGLIVAGSYRRGRETVGDLDLLLQTRDRAATLEALQKYEEIADIISRGDEGLHVRLKSGLQVDFRFFEPDAFGEDILAVYPSHRRATGKVQAFIDYLQRFLAFTLEADR